MNPALHLYDPLQPVGLIDPGPYGRYVDGEGRARTIAAFCLAQNHPTPDAAPMRVDILRFLLRASAFNRWRNEGKLVSAGHDTKGRALVRFSDAGLRECAANLAGAGTRPTTLASVGAWIARCLAPAGVDGGRRFDP